MSIKLPDSLLAKRVSELEVGESAWVVPWAVDVDANGMMFLDQMTDYKPSMEGTVALEVHRTIYGWHIDVTHCLEYRWTKSDYAMAESDRYAPVIALLGVEQDDPKPTITTPKGEQP